MTFHEDHATVYGLCTSGTLYCLTPVTADRTFTGPLHLDGTNSTLSADGDWTGTSDGSTVTLAKSGQCGSFTITLDDTSSKPSGTWSEVYDCHGRSGGGTLTATQ